MTKLLPLMCVLVTLLGVSNSARQNANPPVAVPSLAPRGGDCEAVVYDLIECVSFLVEGSYESRPDASCCVGYESVVSVSDDCICVAIQESAEMGIALNLTKIFMLPTACGTSPFPINICHVYAPAPAPGPGPYTGPISPEDVSPPAPAFSPAHSSSVSFVVLVISMMVVYVFNASN